ncbi:suppressor of cytokine signaling 7 [Hetaerina americana]|uniref:suppressor of cytokine signaling 7 n=1 Tax=Hetaerina americana TaxID=62018 RepID=UPI003A7F451F
MESPPSGSTWLEAFPASDDSGLLLTSGSISSSSGEGCHCTLAMELPDSDDDGKSLSHEGSLDYSDGMSCENFNTLKKGPGWPEFYSFENGCDGKLVPIDPPPEFQDSPPLSEVYQTVPTKNILVGQCRSLTAKSISRVSPASERRYMDKFSGKLVASILAEALSISCKVTWSIHCSQDCHPLECELGKFGQQSASSPRLCWTPELPLVPRTCPGSRASPASPLSRGRPSPPPHHPRRSDSTPGEIGDVYNVPFDSDVYAVPVDVVRPCVDAGASTATSRKAPSAQQAQTTQPQPQRPGRRHLRKRRRHPSTAGGSRSEATGTRGRSGGGGGATATAAQQGGVQVEGVGKRHSVPQTDPPAPANGSSGLGGRCCPPASTSRPPTSGRSKGSHRGPSNEGRSSEPIHMTLQEVRQYLRNLYSGGGCGRVRGRGGGGGEEEGEGEEGKSSGGRHKGGGVAPAAPSSSATMVGNGKAPMLASEGSSRETSGRSSSSRHGGFSTNLRQTLCSIFRLRRVPGSPGRRHATTSRRPIPTPPESATASSALEDTLEQQTLLPSEVPPPPPPFPGRALPPLPPSSSRPPAPIPETAVTTPLSPTLEGEGGAGRGEDGAAGDPLITEEPSMDFASSIEKVKDYGWYWGPISGEAAEKILSSEPDGSFIVRDSSDDHYIFSLTFKLNGCVRHVRIEHDQGNFSFGSCTKFKSHTIVDFIENAVEHSRSGRYLFFLHRRPVLGPMRVQLLHPVSRFKQVQSLQHMCRFVILKVVRRDLIQTLPLPRRIIDYLSTPHYYSEQTLEEERSGSSGAGSPGGGARSGGSLQPTPPPPPLLPQPLPPPPAEDETPPS